MPGVEQKTQEDVRVFFRDPWKSPLVFVICHSVHGPKVRDCVIVLEGVKEVGGSSREVLFP